MFLQQIKTAIKDKKIITGYLAILLFFIFIVGIQINKPLRGDQDFFAYASHKISQGEKPEFSFGGYGRYVWSALAHPPLYIYSVALFIKLFGYNLLGLKFSGIFFAVLTSFLVFLMGLTLFPKNKYLSLIAVFIYLINPLTIQSSLMLDMDGGILAFFTTASIFCFIRYKLDKPYLLGFLLVLGLWTKLTGFIILSLSFFIFLLFYDIEKGKIGRKIGKIILIFAISFAVFFATYYLYTSMMELDSTQFLKHNMLEKFKNRFKEGVLTNFLRLAGGFKTFVIWINPAVVLFFFYIFIRDIKKLKEIKPETIIMYIIILVSSGFFIISGVSVGGIGKYFAFLVPLFSFLIIEEISKLKEKFNDKRLILIGILASIIILEYYLFFLGDPIFTIDNWMVFSQFNMDLVLSIILKIVIILLPLIFLYFMFKKNFLFSLVFLILLFTAYSAFYTSFAKYSTNNNYGDYGAEEATEYLRDLTKGENATIIAERSILFLWSNGDYLDKKSNNAYLYSDAEYYIFVEKFYDDAVIVKNNTYLVIYKHNIYRTPGFKEHMNENFDYLKSIGYYQIYKIKDLSN